MINAMEPRKPIDNSVFLSTLTGVVLLIASLATILMGVNTTTTEKPYIVTALAIGASAMALLVNALRRDRRLSA